MSVDSQCSTRFYLKNGYNFAHPTPSSVAEPTVLFCCFDLVLVDSTTRSITVHCVSAVVWVISLRATQTLSHAEWVEEMAQWLRLSVLFFREPES